MHSFCREAVCGLLVVVASLRATFIRFVRNPETANFE